MSDFLQSQNRSFSYDGINISALLRLHFKLNYSLFVEKKNAIIHLVNGMKLLAITN